MSFLSQPHWSVDRILGPLLSAVVLVIGTILASRLFGPLPIAVNQTVADRPTTFNASGTSEISTAPDEVQVSVGITTTQASVAIAQERANGIINAITTDLKNMGVEDKDIKTENYSIYPQYDFRPMPVPQPAPLSAAEASIMPASEPAVTIENGDQKVSGYQVSANLRVTLTDFAKLNQVIDAATAAGANQVGNIQFSLSETKEAELKKEARQTAIAEAKKNAQELAAIAGLKLGNVIDVQENTGDYYPVYREAMSFDSAGGGLKNPTSIQPGSTTYTYSVTLSYQTL